MCGRYTLFSDTENTEIKKMVEEVNRKYNVQIKIGDIFPSNLAPIIRANTMKRALDVMQWGYHNPFKKALIINALDLLKEDTTPLIMTQIQTVKSSS